ncbi:MAG: hypothetical protein AB3N28_03770 [Kordiimonas sp.]
MTELSVVEGAEDLSDGLKQYLSVCNTIVACNRERFPFAQIWRALEDKLADHIVEFVVASHEEEGRQWVLFSDGRIRSLDGPPLSQKTARTVVKKVSLHYLQDVINDPPRYIANPALIDWDWVFSVSKKPPVN